MSLAQHIVDTLLEPDEFLKDFTANHFRVYWMPVKYQGNELPNARVYFGGQYCDDLPIQKASEVQTTQDFFNWAHRNFFPYNGKLFHKWTHDLTKKGAKEAFEKVRGSDVWEAEIDPNDFLRSFVRGRFRIQVTKSNLGNIQYTGKVFLGNRYVENLVFSTAESARNFEQYYNWLQAGKHPFVFDRSRPLPPNEQFQEWQREAAELGLWDEFNKRHWDDHKDPEWAGEPAWPQQEAEIDPNEFLTNYATQRAVIDKVRPSAYEYGKFDIRVRIGEHTRWVGAITQNQVDYYPEMYNWLLSRRPYNHPSIEDWEADCRRMGLFREWYLVKGQADAKERRGF